MRLSKQKINTSKQIQEIIKLYESGISSKQIAPLYNVSDTTIRKYLVKKGIRIRTNSEASRKYKVNEYYFNKIDTAEKAQILGFLYADGYNQEDRNILKIRLQARDEIYLNEIKKALKSKSPIKHIIQKNKFKGQEHLWGKEYPAVEIIFTSEQLTKNLAKQGCPQAKSLILKFPNSEILPHQFRWNFLQGYFEGDGCLTVTDKSWSFRLIGTLEFLKEAEKIVKEVGVNTRIVHSHSSKPEINTYILICCGIRNVLKILHKIYENPVFVMGRKYQKYKDLISQTIITDNRRKKWAKTSDKNQKLALKLYKEGKTTQEMADIFGVAWQTAYGYLYENKEYNSDKTKSRAFNREQIYQRYLRKESLSKLSEEFNLNLRYLQEFLRNMFKKNNTQHLLKYGRVTNIIGEYTTNG